MPPEVPESIIQKKTKPRWSLLPWEALLEVVEVMEFGAKKHSPRGWAELPDVVAISKEAACRHLGAIMVGELRDPETKLLHAAHLACCALIICWGQQRSSDLSLGA